VLVVVAYGELLTPNVLHVPTIAPVNLHFSLLPQLRGAAPVQTALLAGLEKTGVTTMVMDKGLDTGPVILQREERILPEDDAGTLGERLAQLGRCCSSRPSTCSRRGPSRRSSRIRASRPSRRGSRRRTGCSTGRTRPGSS